MLDCSGLAVLGKWAFGSVFGSIGGNIEDGSGELRIELLGWMDEAGTAACDRVSERGSEGLEGAAGPETGSFQRRSTKQTRGEGETVETPKTEAIDQDSDAAEALAWHRKLVA